MHRFWLIVDLQAYVMAGITTDHECSDFAYAMKERRNGMIVHIREGSAARNLKAIVNGIVENQMNGEGFCFCTDDKHIEDIEKEGHIDHNVRKAIRTRNESDRCNLYGNHQFCKMLWIQQILGRVAPGYQADLLVVDNLEKMTIQDVYYKGRKIDQDGEIIVKECPSELKNTVHVGEFSKEDLRLESPDGYIQCSRNAGR